MSKVKREPLALTANVHSIDGQLLLPAGISVTKRTLDNMPAFTNDRTGLFGDTPFFTSLRELLDNENYKTPLENRDDRDSILRLIAQIELPGDVARELLNLKKTSPVIFEHTLATTLLVARAMREIGGKDDDVAKVARANLCKDFGMSRLPSDIIDNTDHLVRNEYANIKRHPLIGMVLTYYYFGEGLETLISLRHHERHGKGYPTVAADKPNQIVDLITTIDIFCALITPRNFRKTAYDVRGAIDEIHNCTVRGELPEWAPKVIAALYRAEFSGIANVALSEKSLGFVPAENYYGMPNE